LPATRIIMIFDRQIFFFTNQLLF